MSMVVGNGLHLRMRTQAAPDVYVIAPVSSSIAPASRLSPLASHLSLTSHSPHPHLPLSPSPLTLSFTHLQPVKQHLTMAKRELEDTPEPGTPKKTKASPKTTPKGTPKTKPKSLGKKTGAWSGEELKVLYTTMCPKRVSPTVDFADIRLASIGPKSRRRSAHVMPSRARTRFVPGRSRVDDRSGLACRVRSWKL